MQRSITIPFQSGQIEFSASYDAAEGINLGTEVGYLLDDALASGGKVTLKVVLPKLNGFSRSIDASPEDVEVSDQLIDVEGLTEIDGITVRAQVTLRIAVTDDDVKPIKDLLKASIVNAILHDLGKFASERADIAPDTIAGMFPGLLGDLFGRGGIIDLSGLAGAGARR